MIRNAPLVKARTGLKSLAQWIDVPLVLSIAGLLVFGLLMVFSASWSFAIAMDEPVTFAVINQIKWVILGIALAILLARFDYHWVQRFLVPMILGVIILLFAVRLFGETRWGANRTLLPGGSVQPSELAKLVIIIYLSFWLQSKKEYINSVSFGLLPLGLILGIMGAFIYMQQDVSATLTIFALGGILFFLAGADLRQIVLVLTLGVVLGALVIVFSATASKRINNYLQDFINPLNPSSDHIRLALEAVVQGGFFGVGVGRGSVKSILPAAWTDSIYAVIIEELGLFGGIVTLGVYLLILWRGVRISRQAPDMCGQLLAAGVTFWIGLEAFINMGVIVGLFPFAGNALPFISSGGSSMVTTMLGVGFLFSVARVSRHEEKRQESERSIDQVVDLRWRDGRRRVPRARYPASHG